MNTSLDTKVIKPKLPKETELTPFSKDTLSEEQELNNTILLKIDLSNLDLKNLSFDSCKIDRSVTRQ
jgi:hypothetical protein